LLEYVNISLFFTKLSRELRQVWPVLPPRRGKAVPTSAFARKGKKPSLVEEEMDKAGIYVWDGNDYALAVTEGLGLKDSGGMLRVGPVHYNTVEEIHKLGEALGRIATNKG
jgi:selenocysteine lyase/cysteine desulfurase